MDRPVSRYNESMRRAPSDAVDWIPTGRVAAVLGVTPRTVYGLVNAGDLPAFKVGRLIRFRAADVDAYLEGARVSPGSLDHLVTSEQVRH